MYTVFKSLDELSEVIDESDLSAVNSRCHLCHRMASGGYFLNFHYKKIYPISLISVSVYIYINKNELYFVSTNEDIISALQDIDVVDDNSKILYEFFENIIANDVFSLEKYEKQVFDVEKQTLESKRINETALTSIITLKNTIMKIKRYYDQFAMITEDLSEDSVGLFDKKVRNNMVYLDKKVDRLLNFVEHITEEITQVREAYQAQIDIEQNNVMKIFTVLSAVFFPLSIIVGWYGMNLKMPEYNWAFGYGFVILLSILVCVMCYVIFKFKKWF